MSPPSWFTCIRDAMRLMSLRMAAAKTREGEAPAEPLNWSAWHAVANTLVEQQGCGSAGASPWDGETVIRTLADR
ncbi:MAG: hypothetical protein ACK56U_09395, partial [Planctomyces sp.]